MVLIERGMKFTNVGKGSLFNKREADGRADQAALDTEVSSPTVNYQNVVLLINQRWRQPNYIERYDLNKQRKSRLRLWNVLNLANLANTVPWYFCLGISPLLGNQLANQLHLKCSSRKISPVASHADVQE